MTARRPKARQARMEDVARRAGVSAITVSRVLRSPDVVSERTRERVAKAIAAMRYVPNRVAGMLASQRSNVIAAVIPSINHSALESMVQGMTDAASESGLHLMLVTSGDSLAGEADAIEAILAHRPCGLCLHNTVHSARARSLLRNAGIPVVETGDLPQRPLDVAVGFSNFDAARAMTLHLARRGYRRIAYIGRTRDSSVRARERLDGYRAGLRECAQPAAEGITREVSGWTAAAGAALVDILGEDPAVDAVFCGAGVLAVGALMECQRQGWPVPQRLAIAGFDDSELAANTVPPLTSLRIPRYDIGRKAAELLLGRANGAAAGPRRFDLGFDIIERASA